MIIKPTATSRWGLYYGDFSDRGSLDLIEAVYDPLRQVEVPRRMRGALASAYPPLMGRFRRTSRTPRRRWSRCWRGFPSRPKKVEATTLASMVFLNRTNHFEAVEMPYGAQVARRVLR